MFRLISVQQIEDATPQNVAGRAIRCIILADNTSDPLPTSGESVTHMGDDQAFLPGSIAITPDFDAAIVKNNGEWGDWA